MSPKSRARRARILGVGLDNKDGHVRITQGVNFDIFSGSEHTHEHMRETCIRLNEKLDRRGKRLDDLTRDEFTDLVAESGNSRG